MGQHSDAAYRHADFCSIRFKGFIQFGSNGFDVPRQLRHDAIEFSFKVFGAG